MGALSCLLGLTNLVTASHATVRVERDAGETGLADGRRSKPAPAGVTGKTFSNLGCLHTLTGAVVTRQRGLRITDRDRLSGVVGLVAASTHGGLHHNRSTRTAFVAVQGWILVPLTDLLLAHGKTTRLTFASFGKTYVLNLTVGVANKGNARRTTIRVAGTIGVVLAGFKAVGLLCFGDGNAKLSGATRPACAALCADGSRAGAGCCTGQAGAFGPSTWAVGTLRITQTNGRTLAAGLAGASDTRGASTRTTRTLGAYNASGRTTTTWRGAPCADARGSATCAARAIRISNANAGAGLLRALAGAADAGGLVVGAEATIGISDAGARTNRAATHATCCTRLAPRGAAQTIRVGATGGGAGWNLTGAVATRGSTACAQSTFAV